MGEFFAHIKEGFKSDSTAPQWAMARVNSFVTKSKGTWGGADKDLNAKVKGKSESVQEEVNLQEGTWAIPDSYPKLVKLQDILKKKNIAKDAKSSS